MTELYLLHCASLVAVSIDFSIIFDRFLGGKLRWSLSFSNGSGGGGAGKDTTTAAVAAAVAAGISAAVSAATT